MGTPETATLSSGTMATITVAARAMAREDFAAPGTIEDAVVVFARGQRRDLR